MKSEPDLTMTIIYPFFLLKILFTIFLLHITVQSHFLWIINTEIHLVRLSLLPLFFFNAINHDMKLNNLT